MGGRGRALPLGLAVSLGLIPLPGPPVLAQTNAETNAPGIQLDFSVPGARSLAMGGAFLGMADDATAAYANPGGLTIMSRREVSLELRSWDFTHLFTVGGAAPDDPTDLSGLDEGRARNSQEGPSFASVVLPFNFRGKAWAFALYGHQLADFAAEFRTSGAALSGSSRLFPSDTRLDVAIRNVGVALAREFELGDKTLSVGVGVSRYRFEIDSVTRRFSILSIDEEPRFDVPGNVHDFQTQKTPPGGVFDWVWTLGVHFQPGYRWSFGGLLRSGSEYRFTGSSIPGEKAPPRLQEKGPFSRDDAIFHVPRQIGVGAVYLLTSRLRVALDYYRTRYSVFTDGLVDIFNLETIEPQLEAFRVPDSDELHLGFEYYLPPRWYLRWGAWDDQDQGLRFEAPPTPDNKGFRALFQPRPDELHFSVGAGVNLRGLRLDAAYDTSDRISTVSLSVVKRF